METLTSVPLIRSGSREVPVHPWAPGPVVAPVPFMSCGPVCQEARVLLVVDEPRERRALRDVLGARFGCAVDVVANGVDALERMATQPYTLVLADARLPVMSGVELFLWLREARPQLADRFIFLLDRTCESGPLFAELREWGLPILTKPITPKRLCDLCAPCVEVAEDVIRSA